MTETTLLQVHERFASSLDDLRGKYLRDFEAWLKSAFGRDVRGAINEAAERIPGARKRLAQDFVHDVAPAIVRDLNRAAERDILDALRLRGAVRTAAAPASRPCPISLAAEPVAHRRRRGLRRRHRRNPARDRTRHRSRRRRPQSRSSCARAAAGCTGRSGPRTWRCTGVARPSREVAIPSPAQAQPGSRIHPCCGWSQPSWLHWAPQSVPSLSQALLQVVLQRAGLRGGALSFVQKFGKASGGVLLLLREAFILLAAVLLSTCSGWSHGCWAAQNCADRPCPDGGRDHLRRALDSARRQRTGPRRAPPRPPRPTHRVPARRRRGLAAASRRRWCYGRSRRSGDGP